MTAQSVDASVTLQQRVAELESELEAAARELSEAHAREIATGAILKVIAASPADAAPVFEAVAYAANRLLGGFSTSVWRFDGDVAHLAAYTSTSHEGDAALRARSPLPLHELYEGAALLRGEIGQIPDTEQAPEPVRNIARQRGYRARIYAPLMRQGSVAGFIGVTRATPGAFAARDIRLLQAFADQAVIAIENARLFKERQEALERQTATSEILKVIASSPSDTQPVFQSIADNAKRLLAGHSCAVGRIVDGQMHLEAFTPTRAAGDAIMKAHYPRPDFPPDSDFGRMLARRGFAEALDTEAQPNAAMRDYARARGFRSFLRVALTLSGEPIGWIIITRAAPGAFALHHVQLLQTFADQAVIAIQNVRLFNDTKEALQQQTATADVLKVISRSAFDLQAVLDTLVESAARLCDAEMATINRQSGDTFQMLTSFGYSKEFIDFMAINAIPPGRGSVAGRTMLEGTPVQLPDALADADFEFKQGAIAGGLRTMLGVPLLREGNPIGVIVLSRKTVRPFTPRQIELAQTFADQAVIAIENTRLFEEVQARTRDLTEALQQQTATAEVLKVISRSAFDLQAVFDALLSSAVDLVGGVGGAIALREGDQLRFQASASPGGVWPTDMVGRLIPIDRSSAAGRAGSTGRIEYIPDADADPEFRRVASGAWGHSYLGVPLVRDGRVEGALTIIAAHRQAFTQRHIDLVQTFADQAVIAIENVRLFNEVQARTRDLTEALQMQTATSDVLKVISRSAFDLQAVFNTLITSAVELGGALTGTICVRDGDVYRYRDTVGAELTSALAKYLREHPAVPSRSTIAGRVLLSGKVERIPDCLEDAEYVVPMGALASNVRSLLGVPLLRKDGIEGALILTRAEPGEFTQRQIEIVQTFADQAVIALENVRLFDQVQAKTRDLAESLKQQTATAEVLKVISRSAFDLEVVLETLIRSAGELCEADKGVIWLREGELYHAHATAGHDEEAVRVFKANPRSVADKSLVPRVVRSGQVEHIADVRLDADFEMPGRGVVSMDARTLLGVPLLHNGEVAGVFTLSRRRAVPFDSRAIEIVQTFADQAVIAIQNVRLFEQVQARTRELAASLDDLRKTQDRLVQSEKLASLGQLTAGIAHEIKNPLNFVNNFSALSRELLEELRETLAALPPEPRAEADELIGMIDSNLDKVVTHGKRADSIVKNMLLHSREGSGERSSVSVNAMVEEALNLAYHGARAEKPGFNVTIVKSLDPQAGAADLYPQEMTRVLLNLISNGFYATTKRKLAEPAHEPIITASTRDLGDQVEICVTDNGTGIPEEVKAKMFNPFFTTKPAGEGTGLGLSLSHDIVVKQHGGTLDVATEPGGYTQFTIRLPRAGMAK